MAKDSSLGELKLKDVRLSFENLFKRGKDQKNDEGETVPGKFGCSFLFDKKTPAGKAIFAAAQKVAAEVKADKWPKKPPTLKPEKVFLRDGDLEDYDGYAGMYFIASNNAEQPVLVDRTKDAKGKWNVLTVANGGRKKLYSGCYVNAIVRVWAQDNTHGKRLNCEVLSVQFNRHGEPFSGRTVVDPNEAFADVEEADADELGGETGDDEDDTDGLV